MSTHACSIDGAGTPWIAPTPRSGRRRTGLAAERGSSAPEIRIGFIPHVPASVLHADVAGYCRLTEEDEDGTHRRLCEALDLLAGCVRTYRGALVHFAGDAVLARFATPGDALRCAACVQAALARRNRVLPANRRVLFRIGVHVGDVIIDRDDLFGETVNVTQRLQSIAEPGGICVSAAVLERAPQVWKSRLHSLGEQRFKNIRRPVHAYGLPAAAAGELCNR